MASTDQTQPKYIYTELGKEKLCPDCKCYYPLDDEFFYSQWQTRNGKRTQQFYAHCKACYLERYKPEKLKLPNKKPIKSNYEKSTDESKATQAKAKSRKASSNCA